MPDNKHTKLFSKLFASGDLAPEDDDVTKEELDAELEEQGVDLAQLNDDIARFKQKLAGKLAMRRAKSQRNQPEDETVIQFPEGRDNLERAIRVAEDQLGYGMAARKRENATEEELRQILSDLEKLKNRSRPSDET